MRLWFFRTTILGIILLIAFSVWYLLSAPARIEVISPASRDIVELVVASGRLHAAQRSQLGLEVSGIIESVLVQEGDHVTAGQPLLHLNQATPKATLEQARQRLEIAESELALLQRGPLPEELARARAQYDEQRSLAAQSRLEYERSRDLLESGVLSKEAYDLAKSTYQRYQAAVAVAKASLDLLQATPSQEDLAVAEAQVQEAKSAVTLAETDLQKHSLNAPFSGLVIRREAEPGQMVTPESSLLYLADLASLEVYVETDENNIGKLQVGQSAVLIPPAYREHPFNATLTRIGPEIDPTRGVVMLRLKPNEIPDFALPDLTVDVNIEVAYLENALSLPRSALVEIGGESQVRIVEDGRVQEQPVLVRARGLQYVAIEGISPETLVVRNGANVRPGQEVTVQVVEEAHV